MHSDHRPAHRPVRSLAALAALLLLLSPHAVSAEGALSHVYATIKPPEETVQAADDAAQTGVEDAVATAAPVAEPALPAGSGGLSNVYATLKPPEAYEEDAAAAAAAAPDVDVTGSIPTSLQSALPRSLDGFRAHVEAGAIRVRESAPTRCLPGDLTRVVAEVAERFGEVRIMSTHRSAGHNRRAGGASRSMHLDCRAIDFRVAGGRGVMAFLRDHPDVGGLKMYRSGLIHIDNGERRSW